MTQVKNKNRAARDEQRRLSTVISALEEESKDLEIKLKKYKEVNELEVKFQHAEDIVKALKISVDEISNVNQESLDDDMRRLANEILESNNESSKVRLYNLNVYVFMYVHIYTLIKCKYTCIFANIKI